MMTGTLGSSSHLMERVIEISPSPELEPQTIYRPLRRKRPLSRHDGEDSAIELTDSSDSRSSTPCKKRKRQARFHSGPNAEPNGSSSGLWSQPLRCSAIPWLVDWVNLIEL